MFLLWNHEDLSWIPRTHMPKQYYACTIPEVGYGDRGILRVC